MPKKNNKPKKPQSFKHKDSKVAEKKIVESVEPVVFSIKKSILDKLANELIFTTEAESNEKPVYPKGVWDILSNAITNHNVQLVSNVMKYGAEGTEVAKKVNTLLHHNKNFHEVIKTLIDGLDENNFNNLKLFRNPKNYSLLHVASVFNNKQVVEYLLDKGFDINETHPGTNYTPLHVAVMYNSRDAVEALLTHKVKVNKDAPAADGRTPIEYAVATGNIFFIKLLGGNDKKTIDKMLRKAKLITEPAIPVEVTRLDNTELTKDSMALNEFYSVVFNNDKKKHANNVIELSLNILKDYNLQAGTKMQTISHKEVSVVLERLIVMSEFYPFIEDRKLSAWLLDAITKYLDKNAMARFYKSLAQNVEYTNPTEAVEYIKKALSYVSEDNIELKKATYIAAGRYTVHYDKDFALECFQQAEKMETNKQDPTLFIAQASIYMWHRDFIAAEKVANRMPGVEGKMWRLSLLSYQGKISKEEYLKELHKLNATKGATNAKLFNSLVTDIHDESYKKQIEALDFSISSDPENYNVFVRALENILIIFCNQNNLVGGMQYLQNIYNKYPHFNKAHYNPHLNYYEFLIYESNGLYEEASSRLQQLNKYDATKSSLCKIVLEKANKIRFATELELGNWEKAEECLKYISSGIKNAKALIKVLKESDAKFKSGSESDTKELIDDQELVGAIINAADSSFLSPQVLEDEELDMTNVNIEETEDYEVNPYSYMNPKAIHAYYQKEKARLIKEKIEVYNAPQYNTSWVLPNGKMHLGSQGVINVEGKKNFYATIDHKLIKHLSYKDEGYIKAFISSLEKGIVSKNYCSNGIKFLTKDRAEIKIHADLRLWSNKIYVNENGQYLIVFDHYGTHKELKKAIINTKIQVLPVKTDPDYHTGMLPELSNKEKYEGSLNYYDTEHHETSTSNLMGEDGEEDIYLE